MTVILGAIAYALGGGAWMGFRYLMSAYETERKFRQLLLGLVAGVVNVAALAMLYAAVQSPVPGRNTACISIILGCTSVGLFIGAVVAEIKNPPQSYTVRKRSIKYGLQSMSGAGFILLLLNVAPHPTDLTANQVGINFLQVFPGMLVSAILLCSSTMLWKGGRYLVWAATNSGDLKTGSKDMQKLRQSLRR